MARQTFSLNRPGECHWRRLISATNDEVLQEVDKEVGQEKKVEMMLSLVAQWCSYVPSVRKVACSNPTLAAT